MHIMPVASGWYGFLSARVNTNDMQKSIESLKTTWAKVFPAHQPEYFFVDEDYNKQYKSEQRLSSLSIIFSILTIFISCLGLLGLVMVAVSQRIKEIGIRKVLGASVSNVVGLLSKDFLKLVLLAGIIAFPIAWFSMNKWLQDFAYRINIGWWVFVLAGILALVIAFITVSFQAVKAANANPVKNLRTE
jgi:putative ABC transport system permease protein